MNTFTILLEQWKERKARLESKAEAALDSLDKINYEAKAAELQECISELANTARTFFNDI